MKWFKKREAKASAARNDKVAQGIASIILRVQQCWALWMNHQSAKCSPKLRALLLILFLLFMAAIGTSLLVGGFKNSRNVIAKTGTILVPPMIADKEIKVEDLKVKASYDRVIKARQYLDSLGASPLGRVQLDSINRVRPGLNDSLRMAELLYKRLKQKNEN